MRDRVVELRQVKASELVPYESNWRLHPDDQRQAVSASISDLGFFSPIEVWRDGDRLVILDGHLRQELLANASPDTLVPVVITDLTADEAKKALLVKDPLAGMAEADSEILSGLLAEVELPGDDWDELKARLEAMVGGSDDPVEEWQGDKGSDATEAKPLILTPDMRQTIDKAVQWVRQHEGETLTEGRCIELVCADWLSGQ